MTTPIAGFRFVDQNISTLVFGAMAFAITFLAYKSIKNFQNK